MAAQDRNTLKNWFQTQDKPTQEQFWDLIDSFLLVTENIPPEKIQGLAELLLNKANTVHHHTGTVNFSEMEFDNAGVSTTQQESEFSFSIDENFIYIKRPDNHWVRSKIHKEETIEGDLPWESANNG